MRTSNNTVEQIQMVFDIYQHQRARMHLAHSQSTGTAAPARDQKLRRPQIFKRAK
jgi:hypothetical protein